MVSTVLHLCRVYVRLDQPIAALSVFRQGLDSFPEEVSLLTGIARSVYSGYSEQVSLQRAQSGQSKAGTSQVILQRGRERSVYSCHRAGRPTSGTGQASSLQQLLVSLVYNGHRTDQSTGDTGEVSLRRLIGQVTADTASIRRERSGRHVNGIGQDSQ